MGRCAKLGRPDCMRLLGYVARGANCCVRSSAQGWCLPYLGCVRLVRVRRATAGRTRAFRLSGKSASERDIRKERIQQAKKRPETVKSLAASVSVLWRCPTLPQPIGCSTIGAAGLSFQVRNGGWAFPRCYDHHKCWCSTRSPTTWWGVWVDRGLYSGCGVLLFVVVLLPERWLGVV